MAKDIRADLAAELTRLRDNVISAASEGHITLSEYRQLVGKLNACKRLLTADREQMDEQQQGLRQRHDRRPDRAP